MDKMTEHMTRFTTLGRMVDPRYPSNRFVGIAAAAFAVLAGVVNGLIRQAPLLPDTLLSALLIAVFVFVVWALGREYDPDMPLTANVSSVLAGALALWFEPTGILALFVMITLTRIVNRTTGLPARLFDTLALVIGVGLVAFLANLWWLLLVAVVAFLLDASLPQPNKRHYGAAAVTGVMLVIAVAAGRVPPPDPSMGLLAGAVVILTTTLVILATATWQRVEAVGDHTNEPLTLSRVRLGMVVGLVAALLTLWQGEAGVLANSGLWLTLFVAGVVHLRHLTPR